MLFAFGWSPVIPRCSDELASRSEPRLRQPARLRH
jgi:hypothetical protein